MTYHASLRDALAAAASRLTLRERAVLYERDRLLRAIFLRRFFDGLADIRASSLWGPILVQLTYR